MSNNNSKLKKCNFFNGFFKKSGLRVIDVVNESPNF